MYRIPSLSALSISTRVGSNLIRIHMGPVFIECSILAPCGPKTNEPHSVNIQ
jgi:hypothetical protein